MLRLRSAPLDSSQRLGETNDPSIHANVCVPAHDRMRLERLCRYAGRPAVATERLSLLPDGRLLLRLKRRWHDGTSYVIYEPLELVEKLAALVPPPRFNPNQHDIHSLVALEANLVTVRFPMWTVPHVAQRRYPGLQDEDLYHQECKGNRRCRILAIQSAVINISRDLRPC
jgi:hypothetical protein